MRDRGEAELAREGEDRLVRLRRVLGLEPAEPDPYHPAFAVRRGVAHHLLGLVERKAAHDVGCQPHLDAVQLPRLLRAVAVAVEDLVPADPAPHPLGRREDRLEVDGAVRGRLGRVVDDHLAEVLRCSQRIRRQDPDVDEVGEVTEVVQLREPLHGLGGQRVVVPAGDLEQRRRPHRPLEVDVELDLRVRHSVSGSEPVFERQRGSRKVARPIEST
jgi:hypothetical protein